MSPFDASFFLTLLHLLGVAIGVGGAFFGDMLFFSATRNGIVSASELRLLVKAGKFIWVGLFVIVLSGAGLFFLDMDKYMASTKFLSKMSIVLVIAVNGVIFRAVHLKTLHRLVGVKLPSSAVFRKASIGMFISGAVSGASWISALALGSLPSLPFSVAQILSAYALIVLLASLSALYMRKRFLRI